MTRASGWTLFTLQMFRECARYRWTQDNNFVRVEVPLPRRPSETDVALVVGEASFDLSVVNADLVIRGQLSGEANPGRCGWDLGGGRWTHSARREAGQWGLGHLFSR